MKIFSIFGLLLLNVLHLRGQSIEIGQDVNEVVKIIEWMTERHNMIHHDPGRKTYWNWDIVSYSDKIYEVVQCFSNEYVSGLGNINYYCKHYVFKSERLSYTSTRFIDVDSVTINKYLEDNYGKYKIGRYYFSNDYNYYSEMKIRPSGFVAVEWRRAEWNDLTPEMQDSINTRLAKEREVGDMPPVTNPSRSQKENEIKSKTYDLQVHDSAAYNLFIDDLRKSLIDGLKQNTVFPDWDSIATQSEKYFIFKGRYNALYRTFDESKLNTDIKYQFIPDDGVFADRSYFRLIDGNDTACDFLQYYSPPLPPIKIEGYNVMTDARVDSISINYVRGITHVKVIDGEVKYRKYSPPVEIRLLTNEKLKKLEDGLYEVKYEVGTVMDSTFVTIEQQRMSTVGGTIIATTGIIIMSAIFYMGNSE